jgi:signal transduction histidine kinase
MRSQSATLALNPPEPLQVLLVERDHHDAETLRLALSKCEEVRFEINRTLALDEALTWIAEVEMDVLLLDLSTHDFDPNLAIPSILNVAPCLPIVCLIERDCAQLEAHLLGLGAQEVISKSLIRRDRTPAETSADIARMLRFAIARGRAQAAQGRTAMRGATARMSTSLNRVTEGIAHDFNDLIVSILGNTHLAMFDLPPHSPLRTYLNEVEHAGHTAAQLIREIRVFSEHRNLDFENVHVSRLVCDLSRALSATVGHTPTLVYETSNEAQRAAFISADVFQMRKAILNLLTNSAESLSCEGSIITIRTGVGHYDAATSDIGNQFTGSLVDETVYIEIRDGGPGIPHECADQIFEPFFSTKEGGRGLGLPTALGVIRGHHGNLQIDGDSGGGTVARIVLPRVNPSIAPALPTDPTGSMAPIS